MSGSLQPYGLWNSPGQNTGVGSCSRLRGIFPTQELNPGLPHWRQILYHLSHKGRQRILEWVAYRFSSRPSQTRNRTRVSCITGGFFTNWAMIQITLNSIHFLLSLCQILIHATITSSPGECHRLLTKLPLVSCTGKYSKRTFQICMFQEDVCFF